MQVELLHVKTADGIDQLKVIREQQSQLSTALIEGADHSYTGKRQDVLQKILKWLGTLD